MIGNEEPHLTYTLVRMYADVQEVAQRLGSLDAADVRSIEHVKYTINVDDFVAWLGSAVVAECRYASLWEESMTFY